MTIRERLLAWAMFHSCEPFYISYAIFKLKAEAADVRAALQELVAEGICNQEGTKFWKISPRAQLLKKPWDGSVELA